MVTHTYRYRYTAEVEITVFEGVAQPGQPVELANNALADHSEFFLDGSKDFSDAEEISPGIAAKVTKIPTWDHIA
jgi:hypothetical protein